MGTELYLSIPEIALSPTHFSDGLLIPEITLSPTHFLNGLLITEITFSPNEVVTDESDE